VRLAVLGAGGWGTALAWVWAGAGHQLTLWTRRPELAVQLRRSRENAAYLPGVLLPAGLLVTPSLPEALRGAELVVLATPSSAAAELMAQLPASSPLLLASKGLGPGGELLSQLAAGYGLACLALSGPNHAAEVAAGLPAASVLAGPDALTSQLQVPLSTPHFRIYRSSDLVGVQLAGAVKNVLAIAAGLADGLLLGENAKAALLTRGLLELRTFVLARGGRAATVYGLAGLGDLIGTSHSSHSRNRALGVALAQGHPPDLGRQVAEGARSAGQIASWAGQAGIDLPIVSAVGAVLRAELGPREALESLMRRPLRPEEPPWHR
jgi:glycerol-3-phosphate dehydrogenase (NAD(P)+)